MITVGGFFANWIRRVSPPRIRTGSSSTILMICCAGLSACATSAPLARSFSALMNSVTTGSATSASSSAVRISRAVASMSASVRRPLPRRFFRDADRRSCRVSNTRQGYSVPEQRLDADLVLEPVTNHLTQLGVVVVPVDVGGVDGGVTHHYALLT